MSKHRWTFARLVAAIKRGAVVRGEYASDPRSLGLNVWVDEVRIDSWRERALGSMQCLALDMLEIELPVDCTYRIQGTATFSVDAGYLWIHYTQELQRFDAEDRACTGQVLERTPSSGKWRLNAVKTPH